MIPFNVPYYNSNCINNIKETFKKGIQSGDGYFSKLIYNELNKKYNFKNSLLVPSCTHGLEMMALLLDIKKGDEVIIPSYTFVSTANAFEKYGANVVLIDSLLDNPNIDENQIERHITTKTKAICIVHYAGVACNMDKIVKICQKNNIILLEDAAQCIHSFYKGKPLGSFGAMSAFSFHETKNINCGEGGLLVVNDENLWERAHIIREKGTNRTKFINGEIDKYQWVDVGSSYLLSDINAAYLYPQIQDIDNIINYRKKCWNLYHSRLSDIPNKKFKLCSEYIGMNYHIFYLLFENKQDLKNMKTYLKNNNIMTTTHYIPLHKSKYYTSKYSEIKLPNSERFGEILLRLPLYNNITIENINYICDKIDTIDKTKMIDVNDIYNSKLFYESYNTVKYTYENLIGRNCPQYKFFGNLSHHINIPIFDIINGEIYVEIGVHYGHSLSSMAHTFNNKKLIGIDLFDQKWFKKHGSIIDDVYKLAGKNTEKFNSNNNNKISLIKGFSSSPKTILNLKNILKNKKIDLLYIDGDHSYNAVIKDFEMYFPLVREGGFIIFDDYLPDYHDPYKAINDICNKYSKELNIIGLTEDKGNYNKIKPCDYLKTNPPKNNEIVYNMDYIVQKRYNSSTHLDNPSTQLDNPSTQLDNPSTHLDKYILSDIKTIVKHKRTMVDVRHLNWLINFCLTNNLKTKKLKFIEIGVAKGGLLALISKYCKNMVIYGYDSWEGMPKITKKDDPAHKQYENIKWSCINDVYDSFKLINSPTNKLHLIKGYVENTIPNNIDLLNNIDIIRLDIDWYSGTKFCLDNLYDKVNPGGLIIIDDYNWNIGCKKAVDSFLKKRNISFKLLNHYNKNYGPVYFFKKKNEELIKPPTNTNSNLFIAFTINCSILKNNKNLKGASAHILNTFQQTVILLSSIKKHIKSFKYDIHLFSTVQFSKNHIFLFDNFDVIYHIVEPDCNEKGYEFFCRSKCFTLNLGDKYSHRIHLDTDMYFTKDLEIDFNYDLLMTYMPAYLEMSNKLICDKNVKYKSKKPLILQYENNMDYVKIYPPYFNGGFTMINNDISHKFGKKYLDFFLLNNYGKKTSARGMNLQNHLGLIVEEVTDNWSSSPIGVNYFGEWNNVLKTNKYKDKISLVHYLGNTFHKYLNFYDYNYQYISICKTTDKLFEGVINSICIFKDIFWKYGINSQLEWFNKYVNLDDKHYIIYNPDTIAGYGLIRKVNDYYIIDNILVGDKYRKIGFGKQIVYNLCKDIDKTIYLLCEEHNIIFYEKLGFKIDNKVELLDKATDNLNVMSNNNSKSLKKIKYYR